MVKRLIHIAILLFLTLSASAQQLYMQIEVLQPAEVKLPKEVRSLLLMDNTPLTGTVPRQCLFAAATALEDTERFDEASVLNTLASDIDSLLDLYDADAVLALNAIVLSDYEGKCFWTVHFSSKRSYSFFTNTELTPETEEPAAYVGEQMAFILAPYWETEDRYFYSDDNPQIRDGIWSVKRQDWEQAIEAWKHVEGDPSKAYAAANIAVALEMLDRYDEAIEWTDRAIKLFSRMRGADAAQQVVNLRYYGEQLNERKNFSL
jgi:tetratricopeptide (TPR) repeat protein